MRSGQEINNDTPSAISGRVFWCGMLLILLLGAGLRAYDLNGGSIWIDEIWTVRAANHYHYDRPTRIIGFMPTAIVLKIVGQSAPEITGQTIHEWRVQGLELWHIRLAPMIIGVISLPLLMLMLRRLFDRGVALAFGFLLAVAPWHLYWSQLGRYYTLKFLLLAFAAGLYLRATRSDQLRRSDYVWAIVCLFLAYLTHPPALMLVFVFGLDWLYGWIRRQPIKLGAFGWGVGAILGLAVVAVVLYENMATGRGYGKFVGSHPDTGQAGHLVIANTVFMIQMSVLSFAAISAIALWRLQPERRREIVYFTALAVVPVGVMAALGFLGKFAHSRYTFESLFGVLVLAAMGGAYCYQAFKPRVGALMAAVPVLMLVCASMLVNLAYYTTGHHLHKRWSDTYAFLNRQREGDGDGPHDKVIAVLPEVAQYYLEDGSVEALPGSEQGLADLADGKPMWIVAFGATAIHDIEWEFAGLAEVELAQSYPVHTWQPYTEIRIYRYTPIPIAVASGSIEGTTSTAPTSPTNPTGDQP